jgi:hypothetical protein
VSIEYTFTISTDFSNGLDESTLGAEIRASAITTALDYIARSGDVCSIWFKASLSGGDVTLLNALIAAHTGVALPPEAMLVQIDGPREADKKPIVTMTPGRDGWKTWLTSFGDDKSQGPAGRGLGDMIAVEFSDTENLDRPRTQSCTFSFDTPAEMHDGQVNWGGPDGAWSYKDFFSFSAIIPATTGANTGAGNATLITVDGAPLFIPAVPGTGSHQIDLTTAACPIPKVGGGWDVNEVTGEVFPGVGGGKYMLAPYPLEVIVIPGVTMGAKMQEYDVDVYRTDWIHQTWSLKLTVKKTTPGGGWVSGWMFLFRPSNLRL